MEFIIVNGVGWSRWLLSGNKDKMSDDQSENIDLPEESLPPAERESLALERGIRAYHAKNFKIAEAEFRPLAEDENPHAQTLLGVMYLRGQGVPMDEEQGVRWFEEAAAAGFAGAQYRLGLVYLKGIGENATPERGVHLLEMAAIKEHIHARCLLASCYEQGLGVEKNLEEAVRQYTTAADAGDETAQFNLGVLMMQGALGEPDLESAAGNFHLAAQQGHVDAMFNLATMTDMGQGGIEENPKQAMELLTQAAAKGHIRAQFKLA